jgi:RimJ/RimL family protein N-acetyltransferase
MQPPSITAAPIIETERLRLRGHYIADFPDCVAMWSEPEVVRYTIGEPSPPQRTWLRILSYRGHWALLGFGYWAAPEGQRKDDAVDAPPIERIDLGRITQLP